MPSGADSVAGTPAADAPTVRGTMPHPTRTGNIEGIAVLAAVVGVPLGVGLLAWNLPLMVAAVAVYVVAIVLCTVATLRRWATLRVELTARAEGLEVVEIAADDSTRTPRLVPWGDLTPPAETWPRAAAPRLVLGWMESRRLVDATVPRHADPAAADAFAASVKAHVAAAPPRAETARDRVAAVLLLFAVVLSVVAIVLSLVRGSWRHFPWISVSLLLILGPRLPLALRSLRRTPPGGGAEALPADAPR